MNREERKIAITKDELKGSAKRLIIKEHCKRVKS
jgi:hypothetical protein